MSNSAEQLFVPSFLRQLGYLEDPGLIRLAAHLVREDGSQVVMHPDYRRWSGILDYLCCVEYARIAIHQLPTGRTLGSVDVVPARFYSTSLVFFAQACLDNLAVFLNERFQ